MNLENMTTEEAREANENAVSFPLEHYPVPSFEPKSERVLVRSEEPQDVEEAPLRWRGVGSVVWRFSEPALKAALLAALRSLVEELSKK